MERGQASVALLGAFFLTRVEICAVDGVPWDAAVDEVHMDIGGTTAGNLFPTGTSCTDDGGGLALYDVWAEGATLIVDMTRNPVPCIALAYHTVDIRVGTQTRTRAPSTLDFTTHQFGTYSREYPAWMATLPTAPCIVSWIGLCFVKTWSSFEPFHLNRVHLYRQWRRVTAMHDPEWRADLTRMFEDACARLGVCPQDIAQEATHVIDAMTKDIAALTASRATDWRSGLAVDTAVCGIANEWTLAVVSRDGADAAAGEVAKTLVTLAFEIARDVQNAAAPHDVQRDGDPRVCPWQWHWGWVIPLPRLVPPPTLNTQDVPFMPWVLALPSAPRRPL